MNDLRVLLASLFLTIPFALLAAEEPAPPFVAATAGGEAVRGPLRELKPDWSLRLGDQSVPGKEVLSLRRAGAKLPPFPVEQHLLLANGDRIPVEDLHLTGEKLIFRHPHLGDGKEVAVPLAAASVLWFTAPDNVEQPDLLRRQLLTATRARDRVLLRNGDALDGLLSALDAKRIEVEVERKPIELKIDKIAALALSTDGVDRLKQKSVYARAVLADGTRLSLTAATSDGVTLQGTTAFGAKVRLPLAQLVSLDVLQGAAVYLSELKPAKFEQTAYLGDGGVKWPLAADAAVTGRDLCLGGSVYDRGLGMHSRSRATYALDGKYRRFEALVGLDDATGRDGAVRIRVYADGKPLDLGKENEVTAKTGPLAVHVGIEGAKELTLEADFGRRGDVQGHVDWADARLIK